MGQAHSSVWACLANGSEQIFNRMVMTDSLNPGTSITLYETKIIKRIWYENYSKKLCNHESLVCLINGAASVHISIKLKAMGVAETAPKVQKVAV